MPVMVSAINAACAAIFTVSATRLSGQTSCERWEGDSQANGAWERIPEEGGSKRLDISVLGPQL
jgi:hypothetical protein